jgi:hypothetical protein
MLSRMHKESNVVESYVIRIYRRSDSDPGHLVGIVENTNDGRQLPVSTMQQLWEILTAPDVARGDDVGRAHHPQDQ